MSTLELFAAIAVVAAGYLLGSLPSGYLVCRYLFGVDVLARGSQRSGTSNVLRTVGVRPAVTVFALDFLKGYALVLVAQLTLGDLPLVPILVGFATAAGHNWSIFLRFRGGRGVVTSFGAVMVLAPQTALVGAPIALLTLLFGRYVSLASLTGSVGFVIGGIAFYALGWGVTGYGLALVSGFTLFLFTQHLDNLQRLFAGTERRIDPWPEFMSGRGRGRASGG